MPVQDIPVQSAALCGALDGVFEQIQDQGIVDLLGQLGEQDGLIDVLVEAHHIGS